jgi:hypothetical protein
MADDDRVIVFRDPEGNVYVLPWYLVERGKVASDDAAALDDVMESDVEGFASRYFTGKLLSASDFSQEQQYQRGSGGFDLSAHLGQISWAQEKSSVWPPP